MRRPRIVAALVVVPLLSLAACGGGGGSSDTDQITKIIKDVGKDPSAACDHLSAALVKQLGGLDGCRKAAKASDNGKDNIEITSIVISDGKATAKTKAGSGDQTISFVKKDGDWIVTQTK